MEIQKTIGELVKTYKYKALPPLFSFEYRAMYRENIPAWLKENGDNVVLLDSAGEKICAGYERIVIGDYGAYIEFTDEQAASANFRIAPGQEYRVDPNQRYYANVKYAWYTTGSASGVKLYKQRKPVDYADYRPGYWYVSVYEVRQGKL